MRTFARLQRNGEIRETLLALGVIMYYVKIICRKDVVSLSN